MKKITITGSLGNIGRNLVPMLVKKGFEVTVVTHSAERKGAIEALGAKAAIGSVSDAAFLTTAFKGADAVFAMTPPNAGGPNVLESNINAGRALAKAIQDAGVKRVVMLSSIGADYESGTGPIVALHNIEKFYNAIEGLSVTILRAGFFYTNYYNDIPMVKHMNILGANFPITATIPFVHPADIAAAVTEELEKSTSGKNIRYIVSDVRTPGEAIKVLGTAIGNPSLPWVEFTDEQALQGMVQAGLPEGIAALYVEMGKAVKAGILVEDYNKKGAPVTGKVKLEDFAKEFAAAYNS